ncbi:DUF3899 domain-containing protein [Paenibacillus thiaminolyticus]|uniref:DUF3899 domain-containing protein n=1 Tax=Paenibacillus thiaminolyticus TaxID=49283 RepID=UPI003D27E28F
MLARYAIAAAVSAAGLSIIYFQAGSGSTPIHAVIINRWFLYGLLAMIAGALGYVLRTGFLAPLLRGFAAVGAAFAAKPRALAKEDERLQADPALQAWKQALGRKLSAYLLGAGTGLAIGALTLQIYYF